MTVPRANSRQVFRIRCRWVLEKRKATYGCWSRSASPRVLRSSQVCAKSRREEFVDGDAGAGTWLNGSTGGGLW
jgi:hypothetical protein